MKRMFNIPVYLLYCLLAGCASTQSTSTSSSTNQGSGYSEDLSVWRPKVDGSATVTTPVQNDGRKETTYVEPKFNVNKQVDAVLDSIDRLNQNRRFIEGFTIQVYSGLKREDALSAKKTLATSLPELESEVQYAQPNFRVKVGKYFDRINAQKDFVLVKRLFPSAIVIPDKIVVK
jgi:hypothetical protein